MSSASNPKYNFQKYREQIIADALQAMVDIDEDWSERLNKLKSL